MGKLSHGLEGKC